jgi:hypothetical protein
MGRGQAEAALSKLPDRHLFEVWRPAAGAGYLLRLVGSMGNPRRRKVTRTRRNPGSVLERAKRTFRKWNEFDGSKVSKIKGPPRVIPGTLVALGKLKSVVYESDKYTGKPTLYEHKTKRPHPVLAADPDGRHVHIVGGRMKITADGLEN